MKAAIYNAGHLTGKLAAKLAEQGYEVSAFYTLSESEQCFESLPKDTRTLVIPPVGTDTVKITDLHRNLQNYDVYCTDYRWVHNGNMPVWLKRIDFSKKWLTVFEYHVNDHCNMNCKGCGHCANLFDKPSFTSYEVFKRDLYQIRELFDGVCRIRLLGGEPLLSPDLKRFVALTRALFPETDVRLVTNGLLLTSVSQDLVNCLKACDVTVDVSLYPLLFPEKEKIIRFLKENRIHYHITESSVFYRRFVPSGNCNMQRSFESCFSSANHLLSNGRLAACAMPFSIEKLNEHFGLNIEESGWIDIFNENTDSFVITKKLSEPSDLCRYCSAKIEKYQWERCGTSNCKLDDWIFHSNNELVNFDRSKAERYDNNNENEE